MPFMQCSACSACSNIHAVQCMQRRTCSAVHAAPYMQCSACSAVHAVPCIHCLSCSAVHAALYIELKASKRSTCRFPESCSTYSHGAAQEIVKVPKDGQFVYLFIYFRRFLSQVSDLVTNPFQSLLLLQLQLYTISKATCKSFYSQFVYCHFV
jgi:hypothetical protein